MIKFKFEMNDKVKEFVDRSRKLQKKLVMIIDILLLVPIIIACFIWYEDFFVLMILIFVGVIFFITSVLLQFGDTFYAHKESEPQEIVIAEETIKTRGVAKYCYKENKLYDVKKVIDYGDFYVFVFCFPNMDRRFICQKDLLVEGTIEEFEQIFEDKIVRRIKK